MSFEEFWRMYPRKVGKLAARKAFDKALKIAPVEKIMDGLLKFIEAEPWQGNLQFCPHPRTWLHQGRWEDEHLEPEPPELEWWERMANTDRMRRETRH